MEHALTIGISNVKPLSVLLGLKMAPTALGRHFVTSMLDLPNNEPKVCFVATDYGMPGVPLSLACHLKLEERIGWPAQQLLENCSMRLHTSKGTLTLVFPIRHFDIKMH